MRSAEAAAVCRGVHRRYDIGSGAVAALRGVDLEVTSGAVLALMGPSGSGKSTLLRLFACLDRADRGQVVLDGRDTTAMSRRQRLRLRRSRVGFVFQDPAQNLIEHLTVRQHLALAASLRGLRASGKAITAMLDRLGLAERVDYFPQQLSGGQQQRVAIAFAALGAPALLVADEPTGQLDHDSGAAVMQALHALAAEGTAVLVATHDRGVARQAHRVVVLRDGVLVGEEQ